jgi:hypothetical protein
MKRGVYLLFVLLSAWLLATPTQRTVAVRTRAAVGAEVEKAKASAEQAVQLHATPRVLKAGPVARLPVTPGVLLRARYRWLKPEREARPDMRAEVRKVLTRRKVPRLSAEEPPWRRFDA